MKTIEIDRMVAGQQLNEAVFELFLSRTIATLPSENIDHSFQYVDLMINDGFDFWLDSLKDDSMGRPARWIATFSKGSSHYSGISVKIMTAICKAILLAKAVNNEND